MNKNFDLEGIRKMENATLKTGDNLTLLRLTQTIQTLQVITYKGFFDSDLEWVGLERVVIVGSMTTDTTQCSISPRFSSIVHICAIGYVI